MGAMHGMRAEQQIVEGEVEERFGLGAQGGDCGIGGGRGRLEGDDGIQRVLLVRF